MDISNFPQIPNVFESNYGNCYDEDVPKNFMNRGDILMIRERRKAMKVQKLYRLCVDLLKNPPNKNDFKNNKFELYEYTYNKKEYKHFIFETILIRFIVLIRQYGTI